MFILPAPCITPSISYGVVKDLSTGSRVQHGASILVECDHNYELAYNITPAMCQNGTWTHIPKCQPARCKRLPPRPRHGLIIAPKTDHGKKAKYYCLDGYELKGPSITECNYGKWTGETPLCAEG
jgi:hypothetical protein